jgi:hypothetical protein
LGKRIKILQSDGGGEYISNEFKEFCEQYNIFELLGWLP